jgi:hypothetical protein
LPELPESPVFPELPGPSPPPLPAFAPCEPAEFPWPVDECPLFEEPDEEEEPLSLPEVDLLCPGADPDLPCVDELPDLLWPGGVLDCPAPFDPPD